tara:strand:- start:268 stop:570 length:303 start_codon:yes stop_codon:yes gene_type:complete
MDRKDYIKFRTYIVMAKRVYIYVNMNKDSYEGEYVKLSKKDLIDRLDDIIIQNKHNIEDYGKDAVVKEIDTDKFTFVTKDDKRFFLNTKWLGRPEEVWIN